MIRRLRGTVLALVALVGCGDGPTSSGAPDMVLTVVAGDGQFAEAGQDLSAPLVASVTERTSGEPLADVQVAWSVVRGEASFPSGSVGVSGESGLVSVSVRLAGAPGEVSIRAEVADRPDVSVAFAAYVVDRPTLSALSASEARAGETVGLTGSNFSPIPAHNVVLFAGIRGRVLEATTTRLSVEVPGCLPTRTVQVTAQLGSLVSGALPLSVTEGVPEPLTVPPRARVDVDDPEGLTCVVLDGAGGGAYLLVAASGGTVGGASYGFTLRGLSVSGGGTELPARAGPQRAQRVRTPLRDRGATVVFEAELRAREAALLERAPPASPVAAPSSVPAVGERRTFRVLKADRTFEDVSAVARHVGEKAALYVDEAAPAGGFTAEDLAAFSSAFDEVVDPTVTGVFGQPSDLDGNDRIVILFTAGVNRLTPRGSPGFVGGYFFGLDLLDQEGSNHGEVFYALVPDPDGTLSDAHPKEQVLEVTPAILAHEFQHMVHFNQRVLVRGASGTEALWLSEGLAQMSEELVARAYYDLGDARTGDRYRAGNVLRARRYLGGPASTSLIVGTGQGTLEERGAGWLFVLYLHDRLQGDATLSALTATTRTGVANVEAVGGASWRSWLTDWAAALYLDGLGAQPYEGEYPSVELRSLLSGSSGSYPLSPEVLGFGDFLRTGTLESSSAAHWVVVPPGNGRVVLRLSGASGAAAPSDAGLRLRVVRLF